MRAIKRITISGLIITLMLSMPLTNWGQEKSILNETPIKAVPRSQHHEKVSDSLLALANQVQFSLAQPQTAWLDNDSPINAKGIRVIIEPKGSVNELSDATLRAFGVQVEARSRSLIRVRVPAERLSELAELAQIRYIRKAHRFQTLQSKNFNQAVTPIGATLLHSLGGLGQGVKVAVIDVGFAFRDFAIDRNLWPADQIIDHTDYTGLEEDLERHGTNVTMIVHQVAPKAELYLKKVNDAVDLENAVDDAIRQGVNIINHSVGWTNSNFSDGTGFFSELVDRAQDADILWVNAVGNHAESHWTGRYIDANNNGWMDFPGGENESIRLPVGLPSGIQISLTWNDWPITNQDLDLYIYDSQGNVVASETNWQTGNEAPEESLDFFPIDRGAYFIKVFGRHVTKPFKIKIFAGGSLILPSIAHGSILAPADAQAALSVGAVSTKNWEKGGPQEVYSSLGPTSDGRIKPDLVGPSDVYSVIEQGKNFDGTSAAAPHVAGAAALLLSLHSEWDVHQLKAALMSYTVDEGYPGKDPVYGAGLLDLSLPQIEFTRTVSQGELEPGSLVEVTVQGRVPALVFGSIELTEDIPRGWMLNSDDTHFNPQTQSWYWSLVKPGDLLEARYTLTIPEDQAIGEVSLSGRVNGITIGGQSAVTVVRSRNNSALSENVAPEQPALIVRRTSQGLEFRPQATTAGFSLEVYDLGGRNIYTAQTQARALRWNGLTRGGNTAANGVYLVVVRLPGRSVVTTPVVWLR